MSNRSGRNSLLRLWRAFRKDPIATLRHTLATGLVVTILLAFVALSSLALVRLLRRQHARLLPLGAHR